MKFVIYIIMCLPGSQTKLNKAGQNSVLEIGRSAQGFGLGPNFAEQSF